MDNNKVEKITKDNESISVVSLKNAADIMGISVQTIYNHIKRGDKELIENLVRHFFTSPVNGREFKRFYLKASYVKERQKEKKSSRERGLNRKEMDARLKRAYYSVYEILEDRISVFRKYKDDKNIFQSMRSIDALISKYLYVNYEAFWGKSKPAKKDILSTIKLSIESHVFCNREDEYAIMLGLEDLELKLKNGMTEEDLLCLKK